MKTLNKILTLSVIITAMFAFMACDDDEASTRKPVFESITLSPKVTTPGENVTLTINIKDKGNNAYIWRSEFAWVNKNDPKDKYQLSLPKEMSPITLDNPSYQFKAPNNPGTYTVSITPKIAYIAGDNLYDDGPTLTAELVVKSSTGGDEF